MLLLAVTTGCTPDVTEIRNVGIKQYQAGRQYRIDGHLPAGPELAPNDAVSNYYMGLHYKRMRGPASSAKAT